MHGQLEPLPAGRQAPQKLLKSLMRRITGPHCPALQANWYFWLSLCLVITFAGFWMSRYSKAMKLFPVLIIMPLIQVRPELAPALCWQPSGGPPFALRWDICRPLQQQFVCFAACWGPTIKRWCCFPAFQPACHLPCLARVPRCLFPAPQIVWVLFSMISGSLYYQEYKTLNALSGSMFALGVVVLLAGVWLLTGGKPPAPPVSPAAGPVLLQWALPLLGS